MEYYSAIKRNEIGSFAETWMDLETVIQSEASQREENEYRVLTPVGEWYRGTCLQGRNRDADVENGCVDKVGGGDELGDWD